MTKATNDKLEALHSAVADVLKDALSQTYTDKDGNKCPPPAAILSVAVKFLKDNGIEAVPVPGSPVHDISKLPVFDDTDFVPDDVKASLQ